MFTLSDYLIRLLATIAILILFALTLPTAIEHLKTKLNEAAHAGEVRR